MGMFVYWGLVVLCIGVTKGAPFVPGNENQEGNIFSQETPHILSQPLELVVREGNVVRLPCKVDTLAGVLITWRKNGRIISIGDQIVEKSQSKFQIEDNENGTTLVIENVDETDEAHFSCSISTASGAEIDHNVRVITRMSGHEMDHVAVENQQTAAVEEIEKSEQGSGFVQDTNENIIQIDQEPVSNNDAEQEEISMLDNKDESSLGKVYFARIPSFYTFPDDDNKDVTEREQLIKHAPKSVREFLKLLRIYQRSILTKDDIQEFNEFVFEKKPIPNTHLLRSTHAYNSNLRKRLQSANVKEIGNSKVMSEEDSWSTEDLKTEPLQRVESSSRDDVFESEQRVKEYDDSASNQDLNQHVETLREFQTSLEESQKEGSFDDEKEYGDYGSGESEEELNASYSDIYQKLEEDKHDQYSGVRYLQGQNIGDAKEEAIDYISEDKKFPILRGQYLPKVDIEDYDWEPKNSEEEARNTESEESEDVLGQESDETKSKTNEYYQDIAKNINSVSIVRQTESEDITGKKSDEIKSNINEDKSIQVHAQDIDNTKSDELQAENKINWYENRPDHFAIADRYLQEIEIGQLDNEKDTNEEDSYIPLIRGQHLLKTDLQESETQQRKYADEYQTYLDSEVHSETEESDNNIHPEHLANEESQEIESHSEFEETSESYFPLSCCLPTTHLQGSKTEQQEHEDESETILAETVINSKQISIDERLEIELNTEVNETSVENFESHAKKSFEPLPLEKPGSNIKKKSDDKIQKSKAQIYGEASFEREQKISFSPRYLNEDEIEHIEDERITLTPKVLIPVIRGQHLPEYTLEQLNAKHFEYIVEEDEKPGANGQIHSSEEAEDPEKNIKPESYDIIETSNTDQQKQSVKESKNILNIDMEKETLYPQEIKNIERSYFKQKPKEEKVSEMDPNEQSTDNKMYFAKDRKIEEDIVLASSEDIQQKDFDEDSTDIKIDYEMVPLTVLLREESNEKAVEHKPAMRQSGIDKEKRRDGPHPFRFFCMLRKCGA